MVIKTACIIMKECAKCCLDGAVYHITEVNPKKKNVWTEYRSVTVQPEKMHQWIINPAPTTKHRPYDLLTMYDLHISSIMAKHSSIYHWFLSTGENLYQGIILDQQSIQRV